MTWKKRGGTTGSENEYAWRVSIEEIKARNYNLDIKNPNRIDATHGDPAKSDCRATASSQSEIAAQRTALRQALEASLNLDSTH